MKTSIKKTILGMVAITSLFLACGEADSALTQILWSGSMMLICYLSGKALTKYLSEEELS
jgi:hypothetical protein